MNILFIANAYRPALSGVAISTASFRDALEKLGHKVIVLAPRYRNHTETDPNIIRLSTIPNPFYPEYPITRFRLTAELRKRLRDEKIQVVHVMQPFTVGKFASKVAHELNVPLIFTHHARYDLYSHYIPLPKSIAQRSATRSVAAFANECSALVAPSESIKQHMLSNGITKPIAVVPTGLTQSYFDPTPKNKLRAQLNWPIDKKILLCVSRISIKDKNLQLLIDAMPHLLTREPNAILYMIGSGPDLKKLRKIVVDRKLSEFIKLPGPVPNKDLPARYSAADVFWYPSISETQGLITLEAMSAGLAVVATRAPGTVDFINHNQNGLLTKNEPEDFASAAVTLLADEQLRQKFSKAAAHAAAPYTAEAMAGRLVNLYESVPAAAPAE